MFPGWYHTTRRMRINTDKLIITLKHDIYGIPSCLVCFWDTGCKAQVNRGPFCTSGRNVGASEVCAMYVVLSATSFFCMHIMLSI